MGVPIACLFKGPILTPSRIWRSFVLGTDGERKGGGIERSKHAPTDFFLGGGGGGGGRERETNKRY